MNLYFILVSGLVLVGATPAFQRHERDVSHLNLSYLPSHFPRLKEYLPPVATNQLPTTITNEYLPPVAASAAKPITTDSNALYAFSGTKQKAIALSPSNEYLPPATETKVVTEKLELPTNEYLPPVHRGEDISELPLELFSKMNDYNEIATEGVAEESSGEIVEALNVMPQETTANEEDGYHYEKPDHIPDLFTPLAGKAEHLPPL